MYKVYLNYVSVYWVMIYKFFNLTVFFLEKLKKNMGDKFEISSLEKSGMNWKWPEREDILVYEKHEIKSSIKTPVHINSRDCYYVPEMTRYSLFSI
ncbi:hypothetical protein RI129_000033 [Pyrocoelia pectoralis]|uniref:Uncharacterized protein n=1 Tax=Pyrocoelia pectoralis TaxID=417401 RepID=A0AAN7V5F4_9COLE